MANRLKTFFTLCSGSLTLLTVGGFAGRLWWPLELLDHLRWHYLWCLLPCLLYFFAERHAVASVALLFAITINAFLLFPLFQPLPATTSSESLTLQHINIDKEKREALAFAQTEQSDLLFLQEVTPGIAAEFADLLPSYNLILVEALWDTHGSAMLAHKDWRGEVISAEIIHLNNSSRPLLTADITLNQQPLRLLSFHATRSRSQATADGQSTEFAALAEWSTQQTTPLLIVGDFNSTPYSVKFRQLVENSGLQDGQYGHGWQSSWPAQLPRYLRIPIDLTLHGDSVSINSLHAGENVNSDHLPLNISITIQQSSR